MRSRVTGREADSFATINDPVTPECRPNSIGPSCPALDGAREPPACTPFRLDSSALLAKLTCPKTN
jgi:hypothetical protein